MSQTHKTLRIRTERASRLDERTLRAWRALEQRALDGNMFLSPDFVLPALRHLTPGLDPLFVLVEDGAAADRPLLGMGLFYPKRATRYLPLPHLFAYRSLHSFGSGMLVDEQRADEVLDAYFDWFLCARSRHHAVAFEQRRMDSALGHRTQQAAERAGIDWHACDRYVRVMLRPAAVSKTRLDAFWSSNRRKALRQKLRRLTEEHGGAVDFQVVRSPSGDTLALDRFLRLESEGWKAEHGVAIRCSPREETFLREVVAGFAARNQVFFAQLAVGGRIIASSLNFESGRTGFAFKIGWDSRFARHSPGQVCEHLLIQGAPELFPHLEAIDGCTTEDRYLGRIWPDREQFATGMFLVSPLSKRVVRTLEPLRRFKRRLFSRRQQGARPQGARASEPVSQSVPQRLASPDPSPG